MSNSTIFIDAIHYELFAVKCELYFSALLTLPYFNHSIQLTEWFDTQGD